MARRKAAAYRPLDDWVTLLIIVRASAKDAANRVASTADPTTNGQAFDVPLRLAGDESDPPVPAAYWTTWTMAADMSQRLSDAYGAQMAEAMTVIPVGGDVSQLDDVWFFDGAWDPQAALAETGFDRYPPAPLPD
jgi:hypothetical protein